MTLQERVAKAMYEASPPMREKPDCSDFEPIPWEEASELSRYLTMESAQAAINEMALIQMEQTPASVTVSPEEIKMLLRGE